MVELVGYFLYLVPVAVYVAWPPGRRAPHRAVVRYGSALAVLAAVAAVLLTVLAPARPASVRESVLALRSSGTASATLDVTARTPDVLTVAATGVGSATWSLARTGSDTRDGRLAYVYAATAAAPDPAGLAPSATLTQLAALNGGRLPLGVRADTEKPLVALSYRTRATLTAWVDPGTGRVLDLTYRRASVATAALSIGATELATPTDVATSAATADAVRTAAAAAHRDADAANRRDQFRGLATLGWIVLALAVLAVGASASALRASRRRPQGAAEAGTARDTAVVTPSAMANAGAPADQVPAAPGARSPHVTGIAPTRGSDPRVS